MLIWTTNFPNIYDTHIEGCDISLCKKDNDNNKYMMHCLELGIQDMPLESISTYFAKIEALKMVYRILTKRFLRYKQILAKLTIELKHNGSLPNSQS